MCFNKSRLSNPLEPLQHIHPRVRHDKIYNYCESAALPAELIPQKVIFYSNCGLDRRFKAGDFARGGIGVCYEMLVFLAQISLIAVLMTL